MTPVFLYLEEIISWLILHKMRNSNQITMAKACHYAKNSLTVAKRLLSKTISIVRIDNIQTYHCKILFEYEYEHEYRREFIDVIESKK